MKSADDVIYKAAESYLAIMGAGQPLSAEDYAVIKKSLLSVLAEMRRSDFTNIVVNESDMSSQTVPDEALAPLADLVADDAGPAFGKSHVDPMTRGLMIGRLVQCSVVGPTYGAQQANFY